MVNSDRTRATYKNSKMDASKIEYIFIESLQRNGSSTKQQEARTRLRNDTTCTIFGRRVERLANLSATLSARANGARCGTRGPPVWISSVGPPTSRCSTSSPRTLPATPTMADTAKRVTRLHRSQPPTSRQLAVRLEETPPGTGHRLHENLTICVNASSFRSSVVRV